MQPNLLILAFITLLALVFLVEPALATNLNLDERLLQQRMQLFQARLSPHMAGVIAIMRAIYENPIPSGYCLNSDAICTSTLFDRFVFPADPDNCILVQCREGRGWVALARGCSMLPRWRRQSSPFKRPSSSSSTSQSASFTMLARRREGRGEPESETPPMQQIRDKCAEVLRKILIDWKIFASASVEVSPRVDDTSNFSSFTLI